MGGPQGRREDPGGGFQGGGPGLEEDPRGPQGRRGVWGKLPRGVKGDPEGEDTGDVRGIQMGGSLWGTSEPEGDQEWMIPGGIKGDPEGHVQ